MEWNGMEWNGMYACMYLNMFEQYIHVLDGICI